MKIEAWIDGCSNPGSKIRTEGVKSLLAQLQKRYPQRNYQLVRSRGLWYIAEVEAN
jgi:hypothetical protein